MAKPKMADFKYTAAELAEKTGFARKEINTYCYGRTYRRFLPNGNLYEKEYEPILKKGKHFDWISQDAKRPELRFSQVAVKDLLERRKEIDASRSGERYRSGRRRAAVSA